MEWVEFLAAIALGLATMYSARAATKRAMRWLPRYSDVAASGAAGLALAAIGPIGNRLPLLVLFPLITALIGVYVGVLLSGSGWRHHAWSRVAFFVTLLAVSAAWHWTS
jgi:hypothetical protein